MNKPLLSEEEIRTTGILECEFPRYYDRHMPVNSYTFKLTDEVIAILRAREYTVVQVAHSICTNILKRSVAAFGCYDIYCHPYAAKFSFYQTREASGPTKSMAEDHNVIRSCNYECN